MSKSSYETSVTYKNTEGMFKSYPDVMNVKQVMTALHICRSGVYALLRSGKLHYLTIGRVYRIPKTSLIAYVNQEKSMVK